MFYHQWSNIFELNDEFNVKLIKIYKTMTIKCSIVTVMGNNKLKIANSFIKQKKKHKKERNNVCFIWENRKYFQ